MNAVSLINRPVLSEPGARERRTDARWLITFADLAAVMVAFFVLLFSMAEVDSDKWEGATNAFDRQFHVSETKVTPRPVESSNITQRVQAPGLDLHYLAQVIGAQLQKHEALRDVRLAVSADQLALDFPGQLIFANGRSGVSKSGRQTLFVLSNILSGIGNGIAIVGHAAADPAADGAEEIDWELALARAARISRSLKLAGYDRPIQLQGRSGSCFDAPPPAADAAPGARPARRIEIIILTETGDGE